MTDKQPDLFAPPPAPPADAKWRPAPEAKADPQCPHELGEFDRFGWGRCTACGVELVTAPEGARGPHW